MNQLSVVKALESMILLFDSMNLDSSERQLVIQLFVRLETKFFNDEVSIHKVHESTKNS